MECPIERLMKYLEYDSSTVIALTQYKSLWKTFLRKIQKDNPFAIIYGIKYLRLSH